MKLETSIPFSEKSGTPGVPDFAFTPLLEKLLSRRGFESAEDIRRFLFPEIAHFQDPFLMKGMKDAVQRILKAVQESQKVMIHGDYDVDGITGAALVTQTLRHLGAVCRIFLPDRREDGYGVSRRAIREAAAEGIQLLITVDCGITAREAIAEARDLGLDVIVIDHHQVPEQGLPPANVILNPYQKDCGYSFKGLSAAGLAFKLSQALLGRKALEFLDLAALSTVCDAAPLREENRVIVKHGLKLLTQRSNLGIRSLSEEARLKGEMNVGHIGFALGPRLNAAGRMSSPEIALQLLVSTSEKEAASLAKILEEENRFRQKEERQMVKEAVNEVERTVNFSRDRVIVVAREGWHQGVIGIVAARLVEKYHRPSIVIALENGQGKGSGRSIKNFALHLAMQASKETLMEFGGHAQAAGLSIKQEKVQDFRKAVNAYAAALEPVMFEKNIQPDLEIELSDLKSVFVNELSLLEPHGVENPRPVFLTRGVVIKKDPERLYANTIRFYVEGSGRVCEVVWSDRMESEDMSWIRQGVRADLYYTVKIKTWQGIESMVLEVKKAKPQL